METRLSVEATVESTCEEASRRALVALVQALGQHVRQGTHVFKIEHKGHDPVTGELIKCEGTVSITDPTA